MKQWISKILAVALFAALFSGIAWPRLAEAAYDIAPEDIVIDNIESAYVTVFGPDWSTGNGTNAYSPPGYTGSAKYYSIAPSKTKNQYVEFKPSGAKKLAPGYYNVSVASRGVYNLSNVIPVEIHASKDYDIRIANMRTDAGSWKFIGTYYFSGDETEYVRIGNEGTGTTSNDYVVADAVLFSPNSAVTDPPPANLDATLSGLMVDTGALSPEFNRGKIAYELPIGQADSVSVTATVNDAVYASLRINGTPAVSGAPFLLTGLGRGTTTVPVVVSAVYGDQSKDKTYSILVKRDFEKDADLSALTVSIGELAPAFDKDTVTYNVYAELADHSIAITATAHSQEYNSLTVGGAEAVSGQPVIVSLGFDLNVIPIVVTAQDGTTKKTYTVNVIREIKKGDVTGPGDRPDGHFTIADLGFTAFHYGTTATDSNWDYVKKADFNGDGIIDDDDIQFVAGLIEE
ncbi:cadherin-like beta sandwich domain-containing protein [Paenibacillus sp. YN15]|uniref:cadherin-like beta sandwich domain-containing protein n=1 Tax=Paenibacillus sp. YN15 TaxID=1742774 RepID=UPI000DCBA631|nr:cadherin-like beta sandwich domain-containing protein [Paenibacillus sp. YN15]RAU95723.1 hypothetical protein DQG13_21695 [Paenibacillus sp. YN15]